MDLDEQLINKGININYIDLYGSDFIKDKINVLSNRILKLGITDINKFKMILNKYLTYNYKLIDYFMNLEQNRLNDFLNINNKEVEFFIKKLNHIDNIEDVLLPDIQNKIKYLVNNILINGPTDKLFDEINNKNFFNLINVLNSNTLSRINANMLVSKFRDSFLYIYDLSNISDKEKRLINEMFNIYVDFDIKSFEQFEEEKNNLLKSDISVEKKVGIIFNIDLNTLRLKLNNLEYIGYNKDVINTIKDFVSNNSSYEKVLKYSNVFYETNDLVKKDSIKSITTSLTKISNHNIILLNCLPFRLLVHKLCGLSNSEFANRIYEDKNNWYIKNDRNYLSTSLISDKNLSFINKHGVTLGFNNINQEQIIDVSIRDLYSLSYFYKNKKDNRNSLFLNVDNLVDNSIYSYNEIVINRVLNNKVIKPNFILSIDKINDLDKEFSEFFNIPIILLDKYPYIKKLLKEIEYYKDKDVIKYCNCMLRLFYSICDNFTYLKKFLNEDTLIKEKEYFNKSNIKEKTLVYKIIDTISNLYNQYD